ncbi:MAG: hypothetical protein Q4C98_02445 [Capnocytophaga sp.]|nr:hypothetical protein [Capnocytophaga sp.]
MKVTKFILYSLIYIVIAALVTFVMGRNILKTGKTINTTPREYTEVNKMDFWYYSFDTDYLNVSIIVADDTIKRQYFIPTGQENELLSLLQSEKIISTAEDFLKAIPKDFAPRKLQSISQTQEIQLDNGVKLHTLQPEVKPISLSKDQLRNLHSLEIIRDSNGDIQFLALNGKTLSGSKPIFRKYITIAIGYVVMIFGGLALVLMPFNIYFQVKDYYNEGKPFYIPNRWESFKKFFNLFRR